MKLKNRLVVLLGVLAMLMLVVTPVFALQADTPEVGLSESQLVLIGLIASVVLWVLRLVVKSGYSPSKEVVAVALYVISFFLAVWFSAVVIPPFSEFSDAPSFVSAFIAWVGALLSVASPVAGMAYLIYNVLLQRVLEAFKAKALGK